MRNPECSCPHDGPFAMARDASCPVHGTPTVVTDSQQPNGECLHTIVRADYSASVVMWRCIKCDAAVAL